MTTLRTEPDLADGPGGAPTCAHCGLDVPAAMFDRDADEQFCCAGCRAVYQAILGCGLDRFYALRDEAGAATPAADARQRGYAEFDDDTFRARHVRRTPDGLSIVELALEGVHCVACLWLIERLPQVLPGVAEARLNLTRKVVRVLWDDATVPLSRVARQLAAFGYVPHALTSGGAAAVQRSEDRRFLVRIAIAGAIAGNVMLIAFALYGGMFHGIEPVFFHLFRSVSLGLTVVSLAGPGRVFLTSAWAALRARSVHMDVPIAVGLVSGTAWSALATLTGVGEVYFDSITLLVFLLLVGRWIQVRQQRRSRDAVELLYSMTPRHARKLDGDDMQHVKDVPIETLRPGDIVEVRAGDTVPVDGTVLVGTSALDRAWLTGESRPVPVAVDDRVHAGSTNLHARLEVRVEATGEATRAGGLMRLVEESALRRAPVVRTADRIAGVFVVVVLAAALVTVLLWWNRDRPHAIEHAIALLMITCPCALGLATPLAIVAGIGRAAREGILIKGGDIVEALAGRRGLVCFDKTGTLTEGRMSVRAWEGPEDAQAFVAALERESAHPIAHAFVAAYGAAAHGRSAVDVTTVPGGLRGTVDGREVVVGSRAGVTAQGVSIPAWTDEREGALTAQAWTPIFIALDGTVVALAALGDSIRPDAAPAIARLRGLGWDVAMLSGDHPDVAVRTGALAGIPAEHCHGGVMPEAKLAFVESAARTQPVVMVGDGVNDAAALTAATVGVAVHGGAEASLASADVYLTRDDLAALPALITGAGRTLFTIRRGLVISLTYNVIGGSLAMAGLVNPLVAAILMPISSLTVIALAFKAKTFEVEREHSHEDMRGDER